MLYQDLPDNLYIVGTVNGKNICLEREYYINSNTIWLPVWLYEKDCIEFNQKYTDGKPIAKVNRSFLSQLIYNINDEKGLPISFLYFYFNPSWGNIDPNEQIINLHDRKVINLKRNFGYLFDVIDNTHKIYSEGIEKHIQGIDKNISVIENVTQDMDESRSEIAKITQSMEEIESDLADFGKLGKKRNRYLPKEVRKEVWDRDVGCCTECGSSDHIEYDHIVPVSKGGSNTASNIELLCRSCNRKKSDKEPGYH